MTLKQTKNLVAMQIARVTPSSVRLLLRGKSNSVILRKLILSSTNLKVLDEMISHFVNKAKVDVHAKLFLDEMVSEKFNKNPVSRWRVLTAFHNLSIKGDSFGLRGLLIGVKDSDESNCRCALAGLSLLAQKGISETLPGLIVGLKDKELGNHNNALRGVKCLAKLGNKEAQAHLKRLRIKWD